MLKQVSCPFHDGDHTPSYTIYPDGSAYCFACAAYTPSDGTVDTSLLPPKPKEDLDESIDRIDNLAYVDVRGLLLRGDSEGYYIVWPDGNYYKKRLYDETKGKYRCPVGHVKPLLSYLGTTSTLLVIEGELNALSAYECCDHHIVCPGGAGDFKKASREILTQLWRYDSVLIIVDEDEAGAMAAIDMKAGLLSSGKPIKIEMVGKPDDFNYTLEKYGKEALTKRILDLSSQL